MPIWLYHVPQQHQQMTGLQEMMLANISWLAIMQRQLAFFQRSFDFTSLAGF